MPSGSSPSSAAKCVCALSQCVVVVVAVVGVCATSDITQICCSHVSPSHVINALFCLHRHASQRTCKRIFLSVYNLLDIAAHTPDSSTFDCTTLTASGISGCATEWLRHDQVCTRRSMYAIPIKCHRCHNLSRSLHHIITHSIAARLALALILPYYSA